MLIIMQSKIVDLNLMTKEQRELMANIAHDDKIDGLHYFTHYIKFNLGRCTFDASQEIRNNYITREEAKSLCKKFDGELPKRY